MNSNIFKNILNAIMNKSTNVQTGVVPSYMIMHSPETKLSDEIKDDIILITQFYISLNKERHKEIQECLGV